MTAPDYAALVEKARTTYEGHTFANELADAIEHLTHQVEALRSAVKIAVDYARNFEGDPFVEGEDALLFSAAQPKRETLLDAHAAQVEREGDE